MGNLPFILLGLHVAVLVNTWLNWSSITRRSKPRRPGGDVPFVSVLVPARNEAENLPRLIASFQSLSYPEFELILYDDQSEDATWEIIQAAAAENAEDGKIRGIKGGKIPPGWIGKVHACRGLADAANGDTLLFMDADTEFLHEKALSNLTGYFQAAGPGSVVVTGMPDIRGGGLILVSMVGHFILSLVPWWLGNRIPFALMAGLNGQCWIIDADVYRRFAPHEAVRDQVLEDIMIGRYLHGKGVAVRLVNLQNDVAVNMYDSFAAAWRGFRKNASAMLGRTTSSALAVLSIYVTLYIVAPVFYPVLYLSQFILKLSTDRMIRQPLFVSAMTPVSILTAALVALDSIIARARNRIEWKGRRINRAEYPESDESGGAH